ADDGMPATSDFVKKLYKMLEDQSFQHVVSWGPHGDCFVVKDMNEFTKSILPRMFKHSNFASFVRQLNKYDFHKVKNTDEGAGAGSGFGEHSWTFRHPDFRADRRDALEHIKRKVPAAAPSPTFPGAQTPPYVLESLQSLQNQVARMEREKEDMQLRMRNLERNYQDVLVELVGFQRGMAQQDGLMQNLLQYFLRDSGGNGTGAVQGEASLNQMNELSRRAELTGWSFDDRPSRIDELKQRERRQQQQQQQQQEAQRLQRNRVIDHPRVGESMEGTPSRTSTSSPRSGEDDVMEADDEDDDAVVMPSAGASDGNNVGGLAPGLQVYTVGHLMPRSSATTPSDWPNTSSSSPTMKKASSPKTASSSTGGSQKLRVRRSTFVPGWAVPPRVLLVDDDAVSRKLSSKFLQIYGCTTDVAVDGVGAVNKMNLEKYDLVLMDIVMPKLDGVSATSLIRKFDHMTPIISMTGNAKPNEIMTYYSSGMNDVLPKPFSKEGLFEMLEKHLMHLKVIQQMSRNVPRGVGIPPLSDRDGFNFGLGSWEDDGRVNPLAGMGLTDEQYNMILQNIVTHESFIGGMGALQDGD
ncbi:hypothetical protein FISHEDRAFT_17562, partial [Fistulina hepatica ATCC 64428]